MKNLMINVIKVSIAFTLILYLVKTDQLDFSEIGKVLEKPSLTISLLAYWLLGPTLLGSVRWRYLLMGCGYSVSLARAIKLQMTGFFFNTAMPGAVGGDLVKVLYVIRDNRHLGKTPAIMSIFLDRLIGLSGLFMIGLITAVMNYSIIKESQILISIVGTLATVCLGTFLFFFAALYHYRTNDPFLKLLNLDVVGFSKLKKIYECVRQYRDRREVIFKCFGISMLIQLFGLSVFVLLTKDIIPQDNPTFGAIATVFPIGLFTIALPIAPGGLGVGHIAFDRLFEFIGYTQGATIFNVFILSQLALNLLGAIPYLRLKKQEPVSNINSVIST